MADRFSVSDPLSQQLDTEDRAIRRRTLTKPTAKQADSQQGDSPEEAGAALDAFEGYSAKSGVPVNILIAAAEAKGAQDTQSALRLAEATSLKLGRRAREGERIDALLAEEFGDEETAKKVAARASEIGARLYPDAEKVDIDGGPRPVSDTMRQLGGSVVSAGGAMIEGVGRELENTFTPMSARTEEYRDPETGERRLRFNREDGMVADAAEWAGDRVRGWGEAIKGGVSADAKRAMQESTPDGDLFDPSTWTFGEAPSLQGYSMLAADVLGSLLPVVATAVVTRGKSLPTAAAGGAQGAGAAAESAREIVAQAAEAKLPDGRSQLEAESAYYREALATGMDPDAALQATQEAAANTASSLTAPISAFGGAATGAIISGTGRKAVASRMGERFAALGAKTGRAGRAAGTAALSAGEEGLQEAAESLATRYGVQAGTGLDVDVTEGTFGDFVLGSLGGAIPGAASGAMSAAPLPQGAPEPDLDDDIEDDAGQPASEQASQPAPAAPLRPAPQPGSRMTDAELKDAALGRMTDLQARARGTTAPDGTQIPPVRMTPEEKAEYQQLSAIADDPASLAQLYGVERKGQLETQLDESAPRLLDFEPGAPVEVIDNEDGIVDVGEFVAEGPYSITLNLDGEPVEVPRDRIEAGSIILRTPGAEDAAPAQQPAPQDDIGATWDDDAPLIEDEAPETQQPPQDTLTEDEAFLNAYQGTQEQEPQQPETQAPATDDELGAAFDDAFAEVTGEQSGQPDSEQASQPEAPEPGEGRQDTGEDVFAGEPIRTKTGKPFANEKQGKRALKSRGLDPDAYTFQPEGEGVVAIPVSGDVSSGQETQKTPEGFLPDFLPEKPGAASQPEAQGETQTDEYAALPDNWWQSLPKLRASAQQLGLSREELGAAWQSKEDMIGAVDDELTKRGDTGQFSPYRQRENERIERQAAADAEWQKVTDAGFEWVEGSAGDYTRTVDGKTQTIRSVTGGYALMDDAGNVDIDNATENADDLIAYADAALAAQPASEQASQPKGQGDPEADFSAFMGKAPDPADFKGRITEDPLRPGVRNLAIDVTLPSGKKATLQNVTSGVADGADPQFMAEMLLTSFPSYEQAFANNPAMRDTLRQAAGLGAEQAAQPASEQASQQADQEPASQPKGQGATTDGAGTVAGYTYKLSDAFEDRDRRAIAKLRDDKEGNDFGELTGKLDEAARRFDAAMRAQGRDIRDYDARGLRKGTEGDFDQNAQGIRAIEAITAELLDQPGVRKTGKLDFPPFNDETGEWDDAQTETQEVTAQALMLLDQIEAMGTPSDELATGQGTGEGDTAPMPDDKLLPEPKGTRNIDALAKRAGEMSPEDAAARLDYWKMIAKEIGDSGKNSGKAILSLFDYTGAWAQPWRDAGYKVLQLDVKTDQDILRDEARILERIEEARQDGMEFVGVLAACPCTTFTVTGNRWRETLHDKKDPEAVAKVFGRGALYAGAESPLDYNRMLVEATKDMIRAANPSAFHVIENPIGRIGEVAKLPAPLARFQPHNFGDPYTKRTQLFGAFDATLPTANVDPKEGSKMQSKLRGTDPLGKEARSTTPEGFAYAFFMANDPDARQKIELQSQPKADAASETDSQPDSEQAEQAPAMSEADARKIALDLVKRGQTEPASGIVKGAVWEIGSTLNMKRRTSEGEKRLPAKKGVLYIQPERSFDVFQFKIADLQKELEPEAEGQGEAEATSKADRDAERAKLHGANAARDGRERQLPGWAVGTPAAQVWLDAYDRAKAEAASGPGPWTTPGTKYEWADPAGWLAAARRINQRKASAARTKDAKAHMQALADMPRAFFEAADAKTLRALDNLFATDTKLFRRRPNDGNQNKALAGPASIVSELLGAKTREAAEAQAEASTEQGAPSAQPSGTENTEENAAPSSQNDDTPVFTHRDGKSFLTIESVTQTGKKAWETDGMYELAGAQGGSVTGTGATRDEAINAGLHHVARMTLDQTGKAADKLRAAIAERAPHVLDTARVHQIALKLSALGDDYGAQLVETAMRQARSGNGFMPQTIETYAKRLAKWEAKEATEQDSQPDSEQADTETTKAAPIGDFGEKIGGARKDRAKRLADSLRLDQDTESLTLADAFPQPNLDQLAEDGLDAPRIALVAALRGSIPKKPTRRYESRQPWVEHVEEARSIAAAVIDGTADVEGATEAYIALTVPDSRYMRKEAVERQREDQRVFLAALGELDREYQMEAARFGGLKRVVPLSRSEEQESYRLSRAPGDYRTVGAKLDMTAEAVAKEMKAQIDARRTERGGTKGGRKPLTERDLATYRYRATGEAFIGFKGQSGTVEVRGGFKNSSEARSYRDEHLAELLEEAEKMRDGLNERRAENRERIGIERRTGDVKPDDFLASFGLKGVEFGNYVEGKRRQSDLNRAYDALMDMAGALRIDPRAIGLGGKLGLAFGARGTGGRNPAAAHFEPGYFAINLTKGSGPGSLAHEWWHAYDNMMGKIAAGKDANADIMATNGNKGSVGVKESGREKIGNQSNDTGSMTTDEKLAFMALRDAVRDGPWFKRSEKADRTRSKPYFATTVELTARGFEKMIVDRLAARSMQNDYLANIDQTSGAYPTTDELIEGGIRGAYEAVLHNLADRLRLDDGQMPAMNRPGKDALRVEPMPKVGDTFQTVRNNVPMMAEITGYEPGNGTYTVTYSPVKGDTKSEKFHAVMDDDQTATVYGEKDLRRMMHAGTEEAKAERAERDKRDAERKAEREAKQEERDARNAVVRAKLDAFAKAKGKKPRFVADRLSKLYNFMGQTGTVSRANRIVQLIEDEGATVAERGGKKNIVWGETGQFSYGADTWTRLGIQFAEYLIEQGAKADSQQASQPTSAEVDAEAANADPSPTEAQAEAGNYRKGHIRWNGYDLAIETAKGAERTGTAPDGTRWSVTMPAHYGDIKGTKGADGDPLDFYMGEMPDSDLVVIVNQIDPKTRAFDEHKIVLGTGSQAAARGLYQLGFSDGSGKSRIGSVTVTDVAGLKTWIETGDMSQPTQPIEAGARGESKSPQTATDDELGAAFDEAFAEITGDAASEQASQPEGQGAQQDVDITSDVPTSDPEEAWDGASSDERADMLIAGGWAKADGSLSEAGSRNLDRDWKDLTDTAKKKVKAGLEGQGAAPRSAGEAASSAVSNTAEGFGDIAEGLGKLFGGANKLSSGFTFDRESYEAAKPYFIDGIKRLNMAGADIKDMMAALIRALLGAGLSPDAVKNMRPYAVQFVKDVQAGEIDLDGQSANVDTEGATDDAPGNQPNDPDALADDAPQGAASDPAGDAGTTGGRASGAADGGAGRDGAGGRGSQDGVGRPQDAGSQPEPTGDRGLSDPRTGANPGNFVISDDFALGEGTPGQKLKANLAAIRLVSELESANRYPTPEEQATLAAYVGWGGLSQAFDIKKAGGTDQWGRAYAELKELLTPEEYRAAAASTRNAHFTSRTVVKGMWEAMRQLGYTGGRALEPTVGTGNFLGLEPADFSAATEWYAAELDTITGKIAKHLYPSANVMAGTAFQKAPFQDGVFDIAIGNPPFGNQKIKDKSRPDLDGLFVHNYIMGKTGDHLRPGGVMAMVVTHRFLDTIEQKKTDALAKRFKMLGAVRLPNTAFAENAGTEVTTDIVILQKMQADERPDMSAAWLDPNGELEGGIRVNRYFAENPDRILGRSAMDGTMYGKGEKGEYTVHADGRALDDILAPALRDALGDASLGTRTDALGAASVTIATSDMPVGGMALDGDQIVRRIENDANGGAQLEELTPDTLWAEDGKPYARLVSMAEQIKRDGIEDDAQADMMADLWAAPAAMAYRADGSKKPKPTKAEAGIYEIHDALRKTRPFRWTHDAALSEIKAALGRKKMGEDRHARLKGMLGLRAETLDLIDAERRDARGIETMRRDLDAAYDAFVEAHGYISDPSNVGLLQGDVGVELGLESDYTPRVPAAKADAAKGIAARKAIPATAKKAAILGERVFYPKREITTAANARDGVKISLSERGKLDLPYIAQLTGQTTRDVIEELTTGTEPAIFYDPALEEYAHAEDYLSGNVRKKLEEARENGMEDNARALEAVQPPPMTRDQITPTIRSQWVPADVFEDFLRDLGYSDADVTIVPSVGLMEAEGGRFEATDFGTQFTNPDRTPIQLFNAAAAGKAIKIMRTNADKTTYEDKEASTKATALAERMGKSFTEWVYMDDDRAARVVETFNEKMNTRRARTYDGRKYLSPVGQNPAITLRRTQADAAWRMVQSPSVLLDHVVGAGKTMTAITGVMERKRLGLSKKPMVVVPNHLVLQWAQEWYALYPGARLLAATPDDFSEKNRRRLFARIATGDYDAIIVGHSSLKHIENAAEDERTIINERMEDLQAGMDAARQSGESKRTVKQMQTRLENYQAKLDKLKDVKRDRMGVDFEQMGVDYLVLDESQEFKNLEYVSTGERVVGMNDPKGSEKAFDLYTKVRGIRARDGGVAFATGTPVSNSLVEVFTVMSYLAHDALKERDQHNYDGWSAAYAETQTRMEYTATQKLKPRRVLAGLANLRSLGQLYQSFADVITMDTLKAIYAEEIEALNAADGGNRPTAFPVPKVRGGARQFDSAPLTDRQLEYLDYLVARMGGIEKNKGDKEYPKKDNPLWVLTDARKMSLDIRTVDPTAPRDANGKVARSAERIKAIYDDWTADKGTQLVFSDLSTPAKGAPAEARKTIRDLLVKALGDAEGKERAKALDKSGQTFTAQWREAQDIAARIMDGNPDGDLVERIEKQLDASADADAAMSTADTGFSVYDDLKALLIETGIPAHEIAFIHDYDSPEKKRRLFGAVNKGEVRILLGSSAKMGAGTNVQKKLVAEHHLDAPWRPSDVEQREGRIIRQGNEFYARDPEGFEVDIITYSTEGSSDTVFWQVLERKAAAIEQFRFASADSVQEEGGDSDQYAEFMASSTGNPVFRQKLEAERDVTELRAEVNGRLMAQTAAKRFMREVDDRTAKLDARIEALEGAKPGTLIFKDMTGDPAGMTKAMDAAQKAYEADYATWMEQEAEFKNAAEELRRKGWDDDAKIAKKLKEDGLTVRAKPGKPGPVSKGVTDKSDYAATIKAILDAAGKADPGRTIRFDAGDLPLQIKVKDAPWTKMEGMKEFTLTATLGGQTFVLYDMTGTSPVNSREMARALLPERLKEWRANELGYRKEERKKIEADRPRNEKLAAEVIDTGPRDRAQERLQYLKAAVALAEAEADAARAKRSNRYEAMDTKGRDFGRASDSLKTVEKRQVDIGGETFETTGQGFDMPGDLGGGIGHVATRVSDGARYILRSRTKDGAEEFMDAYAAPTELARQQRRQLRARRGGTVGDRAARRLRDRLIGLGLDEKFRLRVERTLTHYVDGVPYTVEGYQDRNLIVVSLNARDPDFTLNHEAIHALARPSQWDKRAFGAFTREEWRAMRRSAERDTLRMARARRDYPDLPEPNQIEEVIANQFASWMKRRERATGLRARAFRKMRAIFEAISDVVRGSGLTERNRIFEQIARGQIAARDLKREPDKFNHRPMLSPTGGLAGPVAQQRRRADTVTSQTVSKLVDNAVKRAKKAGQGARTRAAKLDRDTPSNMLTDAMAGSRDGQFSILGLVPGRALFNELGAKIPAAQRYLRLKEDMDATRNDWHARTDEVSREWAQLISRDPEANERMMDLMHRATLSGVDPAGGFRKKATAYHTQAAMDAALGAEQRAAAQAVVDEDTRRKEVHSQLRAEFRALPEAYRDMFRKVRDEYGALADEYEQALLDKIEKAGERIVNKATDKHRKALRDIEDDDTLSAKEKEKAIEDADARLAKSKKRQEWVRQSKIAGMRARFEMNRLKGPYFPLARFGQFFVTLRGADGELESFSLFEDQRSQQAFIKEKEAEGFVAQSGVLSNREDLRGAVDPRFVADVQELLDDAGANEQVMDDIWQRWLETLPDLSIRKSRIHRKERKGFTPDAFRAFGKTVFHGAHQLARLKYADDMEMALDDAEKQARAADDPNRAGLIVNEMGRRHEFIMNPTGSSWSAWATSAAFVYYLSVTPAAAVVNLSQTTVVGMPILAAAFPNQGMKGAGKTLMHFGSIWTRALGHPRNSKRLTAGERRALDEAYRRGTVDRTQSHDLASVSETGVEYSESRTKWMARISWLFHRAEVANREITFLTAYRMARQEGMSQTDATDKAAELTWKTHFDYQNTSRPRAMQGDVARVVLTFRNFTIQMLWRLFRDSHQAMRGESPEARREARAQLLGITASMGMHAGITGVWGYGILSMLAGLAFEGGDDEFEEKLESMLIGDGENAFRRHAAGMLLKGVPGHLTGISLSERLGMPNLWFRESYRDLEARDAYTYYLQEVLGPVPGIAEGIVVGTASALNGDVYRGIEQAVPKFVRDFMRAGRYATDGVETWKGDPIIEDVPWADVIKQALGFTPAAVAERYETNARLKNLERGMMDRRSSILADLRESIIAGERFSQRQIEAMNAWNEDVPEYPIEKEHIDASVAGRRRAIQRNQFGATLNSRLDQRLRRQVSKPFYGVE